MAFLGDVNIWLSLILALLYLMRFRVYGWEYRYFTLTLVTYAGISFMMGLYLSITGGAENLFFFHPYLVLQFIFLSLFYREVLENKKITYLIYPVLLLLLVQYLLTPDLIYNYNVLGVLLTHSLIIVYSLVYMYRCLSNSGDFNLINLGVFLYLVSVTLVFVSGNLVRGDESQQKLVSLFSDIHDIIYFLFQLLVFVEWWRKFYRVKTN